MGQSWYKKSMPQVSDIRQALAQVAPTLRSIGGIKQLRIFGSLYENYENLSHRIKDVDIVAVTPFHSEDLIAVTQDSLTIRPDYLEEEGFDPSAVKFSKEFTAFNDIPLDHWVLSSDKKILHWGPTFGKDETREIKIEAESYASEKTGFNLRKLAKATDEHRSNWYAAYKTYMQQQAEDRPTGWYFAEIDDVKALLASSMLL